MPGPSEEKSRRVHSWTGAPSRAAERSSSIALQVCRSSVVDTRARSTGSSSARAIADPATVEAAVGALLGAPADPAPSVTATVATVAGGKAPLPADGADGGGNNEEGCVGGSLPTASRTELQRWCRTAPRLCACACGWGGQGGVRRRPLQFWWAPSASAKAQAKGGEGRSIIKCSRRPGTPLA